MGTGADQTGQIPGISSITQVSEIVVGLLSKHKHSIPTEKFKELAKGVSKCLIPDYKKFS